VITVVRADNPGPMTLTGTNSYVFDGLVVDPGPDDLGHLRRLASSGPVRAILLTHRHADHSAGVPRLRQLTGAPVYSADPAYGAPFPDDLPVEVVPTPGHTSDSVAFVRPDAVLTGDTILGAGTTVVEELGPYLDSLRKLAALGPRRVLPGHGPELPDLAAVATDYLRHREERLAQVQAAYRDGMTAREVVEIVYADVDPSVWPAAEQSVRAQLAYLRGESRTVE
jgi:glyoxylase-like metal-dependent hydrolase (beta-lactamase superfamily II)